MDKKVWSIYIVSIFLTSFFIGQNIQSFLSPKNHSVPPSDPELPPTDPELPPEDHSVPPSDPELPPTDPELPPEDHSDAFVTIWSVSHWTTGFPMFETYDYSSIRLPLLGNGIYDFIVNWGDGNQDRIQKWNQTETTHTYSFVEESLLVTVRIIGTIIGWAFMGEGWQLEEIKQWGCLKLGNYGQYFMGCRNLQITAIDKLDLTGTTNMYKAFYECINLGEGQNMNCWNMSMVTDMSHMFSYCYKFNFNISNWDVSSVTDMSSMFLHTSSFNQDIGGWNVSSVTDMFGMFSDASSFNQDIGGWNVTSVTTMCTMFQRASSFNQDIGNWNVSKVVDMDYMFSEASSFNQDIGNWNVSNIRFINNMFLYVTLSTANYDRLLIGWSQLPLRTDGVWFHGGYSKYSAGAAAEARSYIVTTFGWQIIDGGQA